jgi:hypothetical protein
VLLPTLQSCDHNPDCIAWTRSTMHLSPEQSCTVRPKCMARIPLTGMCLPPAQSIKNHPGEISRVHPSVCLPLLRGSHTNQSGNLWILFIASRSSREDHAGFKARTCPLVCPSPIQQLCSDFTTSMDYQLFQMQSGASNTIHMARPFCPLACRPTSSQSRTNRTSSMA